MTPITIDGRTGTAVYVDDAWKPVPEDKATLAVVVFDDGARSFYRVSPALSPAPNIVARLKAMLRGGR